MVTRAPLRAPTPSGEAGPCCSPLTEGVLEDAAAARLARVFRALGDPARVRLISLIAAGVDGEACICDLTGPVGLSQPTVSHHMKLLADAGLVTRTQRGRWAFFRVNTTALAELGQVMVAAGRV